MKTIGRGRDYKKALILNLVRHLSLNKKVTTTKARARLLQKVMGKRAGGVVRLTPSLARRGDSAEQMIVEWEKKEAVHENRINETKRRTKKVASR